MRENESLSLRRESLILVSLLRLRDALRVGANRRITLIAFYYKRQLARRIATDLAMEILL